MSHWWNCCTGGNCDIFRDYFDRSDNDDLGDDWDETDVDADIDGNMLKMTAGAQAITERGNGWVELIMWVDCVNPVPIAKHKIIFNYKSESSYLYVVFYTNDTPSDATTIEIWQRGAGGDEKLSSETDDSIQFGTTTVQICRNRDGVYASATDDMANHLDTYACVETDCDPIGCKTGLANISDASEICYFDDFIWQKHKRQLDKCLKCHCDCFHYCQPTTLTLTITVITEDGQPANTCDCWDELGCTLAQYWSIDPTKMTWRGTVEDPNLPMNCSSPDDPQDNDFVLICGNDEGESTDWEEWTLCLRSDGHLWFCGMADDDPDPCSAVGAPGAQTGVSANPTEGTCDPLYLKFGPFYCDWFSDPLEWCRWIIEITE